MSQKRSLDDRVEGALSRMDLPELAGLLFHPSISFRDARRDPEGRRLALEEIRNQVQRRHLNHFLIRGPISGELTPRRAAEWLNSLQEIAAATPLGTPLTFSSDPRHGPSSQVGIRSSAGYLSQWPEPIGLGAINDPEVIAELTHAIRVEYRALGIHIALHPQADLATEPRWMRTSGTFGQQPDQVSELVSAYVRGLQGDHLGPQSVACMVKHFPGGGPQRDGEDPHFAYGKDQIYPAGRFEDHLAPFRAALAAGCAQIMPYYGRPVGLEGVEEVGFGFNRTIITDLLRDELGFQGIVCTDWGILTDHVYLDELMPAMAWGMEEAAPAERLLRALTAGVDQFGGEDCVDLLIDLVENKRVISSERLLESARRVLRQKFELGIVDSPLVDVEAAAEIVGHPDLREAGRKAHARSVAIVTNLGDEPLLPLRLGAHVRLVGLQPEDVEGYAVADERAAISIVSLETPYDPRPGSFQRLQRAGRLDYTAEELSAILDQVDKTTVVLLLLDRPAVVPDIIERAGAVVVHWGGPPSTVLDVVFGREVPLGRLPFDLPRSMDAVVNHPSDLPGGSVDPVARAGDRANLAAWAGEVDQRWE